MTKMEDFIVGSRVWIRAQPGEPNRQYWFADFGTVVPTRQIFIGKYIEVLPDHHREEKCERGCVGKGSSGYSEKNLELILSDMDGITYE